MNRRELVDRFCDSPRRWLIVTAVTLVVALVTVLPQVDQFMSLRADENARAEELSEARQTALLLPKFRERVAATTSELSLLEGRALEGDAVSDFRNKLVDLVRDSGCQVRRLNVSGVRSRAWRENDHPLTEPDNDSGPPTPFQLETRPVHLSVTGKMSEVRQLLTRIEEIGMMMHPRTVELRPAGRNGGAVQLDLELWCFALHRGKGNA